MPKKMTLDQDEMIAAVQAYFESIYQDKKVPVVTAVESSGYSKRGEFIVEYQRPGFIRPKDDSDFDEVPSAPLS